MKHFKIFLAFGLGCITAAAISLGITVSAQRNKGGGTNPQEARLKVLEQRASDLEQATNEVAPARKVVAPFEITDSTSQRIFDVTANSFTVYHGQRPMAGIGGDLDGGYLFAKSATGYYNVGLDPSGFSVIEKSAARILLQQGSLNRNYRLKFASAANQEIAAIGEDPETHTGLALIMDRSGNLRARMGVSNDGRGLIDVLGVNRTPIAQMTEVRDKGGYLLICGISNCDPPMVEAGDAGGYGIVRVGPHGFNPGVTMLGLPGSVIMGK